MSDPILHLFALAAATLDWRAFVTDERLRKLIGQVLDNNRDPHQALLNVEAAHAIQSSARHRRPGIKYPPADSRRVGTKSPRNRCRSHLFRIVDCNPQ
jgi:hypothetical protein